MNDEQDPRRAAHAVEHTIESLRGILSDRTRSARKGLLVSSMTGIVIVLGDLVPTRIDAFGIGLGQVDQGALLTILALIILYYLVSFSIYAVSDGAASVLVRGRAHLDHVRETVPTAEEDSLPLEEFPEAEGYVSALYDYYRAVSHGRTIARFRLALDFGIPLLVSLTALVLINSRIFS